MGRNSRQYNRSDLPDAGRALRGEGEGGEWGIGKVYMECRAAGD